MEGCRKIVAFTFAFVGAGNELVTVIVFKHCVIVRALLWIYWPWEEAQPHSGVDVVTIDGLSAALGCNGGS